MANTEFAKKTEKQQPVKKKDAISVVKSPTESKTTSKNVYTKKESANVKAKSKEVAIEQHLPWTMPPSEWRGPCAGTAALLL